MAFFHSGVTNLRPIIANMFYSTLQDNISTVPFLAMATQYILTALLTHALQELFTMNINFSLVVFRPNACKLS